ncbi:MAG: hypothetical protein JXB45_00345 [Candidatus Krumholzibacteriota bacterium]|nr:hypothetical protein [Candidatus Krumholzibacteriota bacterium]
MIRKWLFWVLLLTVAFRARAEVDVTRVDFLKGPGVEVNGAGPLLVMMDNQRQQLIAANTLSSSLTFVDCHTGSVKNVPLGGRALQHLKAEAMTFSTRTGTVYLIGIRCFHIADRSVGSPLTVPTGEQYESIAVDEATGNVFLAGRESKHLAFYQASSGKLKKLRWLDKEEQLVNLNATPPPPIRKVIADRDLGIIAAVDGIEPSLYLFRGKDGKLVSSRPLALAAGGRWHLAGYNREKHFLYLVTETAERKVTAAARIDIQGGDDRIVPLPGFTEGVGMIYNHLRDEVYIPYDNHASVHVAGFAGEGSLEEIMIPAYGNDASALDAENDILYVGSWAHGEVDVIDLEGRELRERITGLGIIPHMFTMAYDPQGGLIYFPQGATAVNGTFGAALNTLDPAAGRTGKIRTGWAPVDLIEIESRGSFLVFNSEDQFAEVFPDGTYRVHDLPYDYPLRAERSPRGDVYLSYGPHQSYWPTVYIWAAKNGILTIAADDLGFYDRRIPRQAMQLVVDDKGALYFTQNNWGKEEQFLGVLRDQVRLFEPGQRLTLADEVNRETTQRILKYDREAGRIYLVRVGESDDLPSILQVIDPDSSRVVRRVEVGLAAADLVFDREKIYVSNFDSKSVSVVNKTDGGVEEIKTGLNPLVLCRYGADVYLINHGGNTLQRLTGRGGTYEIPWKGNPDNLFTWREDLLITSHSEKALIISRFDPGKGKFELLHREEYPFGDTSFDSGNVSFYLRGQFGDALFTLTRGKEGSGERFWITDFLSGKLFILSP